MPEPAPKYLAGLAKEHWLWQFFQIQLHVRSVELASGQVTTRAEQKKLHDGQDSNLRGQRPMDFKSIPLTTPAPSYDREGSKI